MVKQIKGISIEIDGSTDKLQSALKQVDKTSRNTTTELNQINRALKFDEFNPNLLRQKFDVLQDAVKNTETRLSALKQAQSEVNRQFENGEIDSATFRSFNRELEITEGKLKAFQAQADTVKVKIDAQTDTSGLDKMTKKLEEVGEKAKEVGNKMKDVGGEMSTKLTAPIAAFGAGALAAAGQFDNAAGQIQAALGVTADEAEALEDKVASVWKAGFGESLEEVTDALIRVKQNMQGVSDGAELEKVTRDALALAKTFDSDVNEVTRAGNNLMTNFGISSEEAFDMMTKGAQNGLNFSNEMFDNLAEYAPLFADLGFSAEEMFGTLISGSKEGVYNLDYLNDMVKEFGIRLMDGSEKTQKAMSGIFSPKGFSDFAENLKKYGKDSSEYLEVVAIMGEDYTNNIIESMRKGGLEGGKAWESLEFNMGRGRELIDGITDGSISGQEAMKEIAQALVQIEDPVAQTALGVELFGTKFEDLGTEASLAMLTAGKSLEDFEGSMNSLAETQEKTFGQRFNNLTRSAAQSLEPVGHILLDFAEKIIPKVIAVVEGLAKWFSNLSPVMQVVTVTIGAVVAAIGPFLVAAGMIVTAIGQLTPLFLKMTPIVKAAGVAIAGMSAPIAIAIAAVTALIAIGVTLYKNWDQISGQLKKIWETIKTNASSAFKQMGDNISKAWDAVKSATSKVWESIKSSLSSAWNAIKSTASNVFNSIKTSITGAFEATKTAITNTWNAIKSVTTNTWEAMKASIQNAVNTIKGVISAGMQLIKGDWQGAWNTLKSTLSNMLENMKSILRGTNLFSIGQDIISGLVNGIKNMTGKAIEAVTGVVDGVVNKAKNLLGIKSPSRVFMEIGHDTNAGFIEGIKQNNSKLQGAVQNVYGSLANSAQKSAEISTSSIKNTNSTIDNSKYMQPNITIINQQPNATPSELARKAMQAQRQLAMEWGV